MTAKIDHEAFKNVPTITAKPDKGDAFELKLHEVDPTNFIPNGDRYVVEELPVNEMVQFGSLIALVQDPNIDPKDPRANPQVENRGVLAVVVITAGNGHLLGLPDPRFVMRQNPMNDEQSIRREPADVPMFYKPGDVLLIDRNAKGRAIKWRHRNIRVVNQIDCLVHVSGIKLVRNGDTWEQVNAE